MRSCPNKFDLGANARHPELCQAGLRPKPAQRRGRPARRQGRTPHARGSDTRLVDRSRRSRTASAGRSLLHELRPPADSAELAQLSQQATQPFFDVLLRAIGWFPGLSEPLPITDTESLVKAAADHTNAAETAFLYGDMLRPLGIGILIGGALMGIILAGPAIKAAVSSLAKSRELGRRVRRGRASASSVSGSSSAWRC